MNCFQIEVRGITFTIWAPTIQDALETFMIDMEFYEGTKGVSYLYSYPYRRYVPSRGDGILVFFP